MVFLFVGDLGKLWYAQRLEIIAWHLLVYGQAYCCSAPPWQATINFEFNNRTDAGGLLFLAWHISESSMRLPGEERCRFRVAAPDW